MNTIYVIPLFVMVCTWVVYAIAKKRKANVPFWVVMGALFGPLAIPFVFFSSPRYPAAS